jgi:hypothetical protein
VVIPSALLVEVSAMPVRLSLIVLLVLAAVVFAAPAPFPKHEPSSATEVVFDVKTKERARLALLYLQSNEFLDSMTQSEVVRKHLARMDQAGRSAWLKGRVSVTADGNYVSVRLSRQGGPLAVLQAIADQLTGNESVSTRDDKTRQEIKRRDAKSSRDDCAMALEVFRALLKERPDRISEARLAVFEVRYARFEFEASPMTLHRAPRYIRAGR